MRREWIEMFLVLSGADCKLGLPPCGGSGLKSNRLIHAVGNESSPSMRREWIEIATPRCT